MLKIVFGIMETDSEIFCDFNFVIISKFNVSNNNNRINDVPPCIHFTVTMEFWMFDKNLNKFVNKCVNRIYKDFMVFSFIKTKENCLDVYCIYLEYIYKFPENVSNTLDAPNLNETIENSVSKRFHVRCAYNIGI